MDRIIRARHSYAIAAVDYEVAISTVERADEALRSNANAVGHFCSLSTNRIRDHGQTRPWERRLPCQSGLEVHLGVEEVNTRQRHDRPEVQVEQTLGNGGTLRLFPQKVTSCRCIIHTQDEIIPSVIQRQAGRQRQQALIAYLTFDLRIGCLDGSCHNAKHKEQGKARAKKSVHGSDQICVHYRVMVRGCERRKARPETNVPSTSYIYVPAGNGTP